MKDQRLGWLHNFSLVLITVILIAGFILLLYQLATGQGELMHCPRIAQRDVISSEPA